MFWGVALLFADFLSCIQVQQRFTNVSVVSWLKENINWLFLVGEQEIDGQEPPGDAGEHSLCHVLLLYSNCRQKSEILLTSLPPSPHFLEQGKRVWLSEMGLGVFSSGGITQDGQKTFTGFNVLHSLCPDPQHYEAWDEQICCFKQLFQQALKCLQELPEPRVHLGISVGWLESSRWRTVSRHSRDAAPVTGLLRDKKAMEAQGSIIKHDLASVQKHKACTERLNLVHINFLFNSISFQGHKPYPEDQKCSLAS